MGESPAEKYASVLAQIDTILRAVSDGVTIQDAEGRLVYANDAAARACGMPNAKALLAADLRDVYATFEMLDEAGKPVDPAHLPGRVALAGGEAPPLLVRVRERASGRQWWCLIRADAIRDEAGRPELAINIWHDATAEQRRLERERFLAEAGRQLAASIDYETTLASVAQALVPGLADWVAVDLFVDGRPTRVAIAHADPEKVQLARLVDEKYPLDPSEPAGVANVFRTGRSELYADLTPEIIASGARDPEHARLLASFGIRAVMMVPIRAGSRTEGVLTLIDAESGRRFDEHDLALAEELGRRAGTAIENARTHRISEETIRSRDEFLAVAGHELRTPLAALVLQLESLDAAMRSGAFASDPARFEGRVGRALGHTHRLAQLVDELLDVSQIVGGRLELRPVRCDLAEVVRGVVERATELATRSGSCVEVDVEPCEGEWDVHRLEQVVGNLLGNALKYGAGRPVRIECARPTPGEVKLRVIDHGIGVPPADRERVFGRFERAVSERNYGGLGLGLWIVRQVVQAHDGSVLVRETPGGGSTFEVKLPVTGVR